MGKSRKWFLYWFADEHDVDIGLEEVSQEEALDNRSNVKPGYWLVDDNWSIKYYKANEEMLAAKLPEMAQIAQIESARHLTTIRNIMVFFAVLVILNLLASLYLVLKILALA